MSHLACADEPDHPLNARQLHAFRDGRRGAHESDVYGAQMRAFAAMLPDADPIHKVTIIPRGMALGVTMQLPVDDKHNYTRDYLNDQIAILRE